MRGKKKKTSCLEQERFADCLIGLLCRAKWLSQLGTSWMFLIQVNSKVGMKWVTVEEEKGVNILLKYVVEIRCVV